MKKRSVLTGWLCSYIIIMMIPVVTVFVNYAWSMKVIRKEILEANNLVLDNLGDEIDRYLKREMAYESYLLQNRNFLKVIGSRKKDSQFYKDVAELVNSIKVFDSDMSCLIYLKHLDYVIDKTGANESHYLYGGMRVGISDMIGYEEWMEELSGTYGGSFLFGRYLHYGTGENHLVYARSISNYSQYEDFNLFMGVPVSLLEKLTKSMSEGTRLLMGIDGETALTLSSQGAEEALEESLSLWGREGFEETRRYIVLRKASGIEGIEYCLLIPQGEFWRELSQVRNVLYISVAVTLFVGIACMFMALRHNFKPVDSLIRKISGGDRGKGNEYKLIEDAYFKLVREKNVMHQHMAAQAEDIQSSYLLAMMKGRSMGADEKAVQISAGQRMLLAGFRVPLMDEKQILQDEVMLFAVDNIFSELMEAWEFYRIEDGQHLFYLFLIPGEEDAFREHCRKSAEYLSGFMWERLDLSVRGAVSGILEDMEELRFAYQKVVEGLERAEMLGGYGVVDMEDGKESGGKAIVQRVIQYVEEHYADSNLNISTIAEGIERNPKYISRVFKEETREGILDYINRLRIKKAKALIKSGRFSLEQISVMAGYASLKTFGRAFRKETGMTPAGYRDSLL
nr:helix-turn-helix domain-containing protein [uncultured Acetatifactor sp.]